MQGANTAGSGVKMRPRIRIEFLRTRGLRELSQPDSRPILQLREVPLARPEAQHSEESRPAEAASSAGYARRSTLRLRLKFWASEVRLRLRARTKERTAALRMIVSPLWSGHCVSRLAH